MLQKELRARHQKSQGDAPKTHVFSQKVALKSWNHSVGYVKQCHRTTRTYVKYTKVTVFHVLLNESSVT